MKESRFGVKGLKGVYRGRRWGGRVGGTDSRSAFAVAPRLFSGGNGFTVAPRLRLGGIRLYCGPETSSRGIRLPCGPESGVSGEMGWG